MHSLASTGMVRKYHRVDLWNEKGLRLMAKNFNQSISHFAGEIDPRQGNTQETNLGTGKAILSGSLASLVAARKQIEESENRLNLALEACRMGTWEIDLKTHRLTGSRQHALILGIDFTNEDIF